MSKFSPQDQDGHGREQWNSLPPAYYSPSWDDHKREEFNRMCGQLEISEYYAQEFRHVAGHKIVFIVDNSGSMGTHLVTTSTVLSTMRPVRRYDELIEFIRMAVPLLAFDSPQGVDFWFLNPVPVPASNGQIRQQYFPNIQTWSQIEQLFNVPPEGSTPLVEVLQRCITQYQSYILEQGLLFIVSTDGEPDGGPKGLYQLIKKRPSPQKFIVNFRVCSDRESDIAFLNKLDRNSPGVDVSDDYDSERKEVLKARPRSRFGINDYVMKSIIGGASAKLDGMDEGRRCFIL